MLRGGKGLVEGVFQWQIRRASVSITHYWLDDVLRQHRSDLIDCEESAFSNIGPYGNRHHDQGCFVYRLQPAIVSSASKISATRATLPAAIS